MRLLLHAPNGIIVHTVTNALSASLGLINNQILWPVSSSHWHKISSEDLIYLATKRKGGKKGSIKKKSVYWSALKSQHSIDNNNQAKEKTILFTSE